MTIQDKAIARDFSLLKRDYDLFKRQNAKKVMGSESLNGNWSESTGHEGEFGVWALPIGGATYVYLEGVIEPNAGTAVFLHNIPQQYRPTNEVHLVAARTHSGNTNVAIVTVDLNGNAEHTINFNSNETELYLHGLWWFAQT